MLFNFMEGSSPQPAPRKGPQTGPQEESIAQARGINKVVITFRDNELYLTSVGAIADNLRRALSAFGIEVIVDSFPPSMSEKLIVRELRAASRGLMRNSIVIGDYTTLRCWPLDESGQERRGIIPVSSLDGTFANNIQSIIRRRYGLFAEEKAMGQFSESRPLAEMVDEYGRCVTAVIKEALSCRKPGRIIILNQALIHHAPFFRFYAMLIKRHASEQEGNGRFKTAEALVKRFEEAAMTTREGRVRNGGTLNSSQLRGLRDLDQSTISQPAEYVADWVRAAGFPSSAISVVYRIKQLSVGDFPSKFETWIIGDRHIFAEDNLRRLLQSGKVKSQRINSLLGAINSRGSILRLPLENMRTDLVRNDLGQLADDGESAQLIARVTEELLHKLSAYWPELKGPPSPAEEHRSLSL